MATGTTQGRAPRYAIVTPLLFRRSADAAWQPGRTFNLSGTGVLFKTERTPPDRGQEIEFTVSLPLLGRHKYDLHFTGRVVRVAPESTPGDGWAVGVTIDSYQILGPPPQGGAVEGGTKVPLG